MELEGEHVPLDLKEKERERQCLHSQKNPSTFLQSWHLISIFVTMSVNQKAMITNPKMLVCVYVCVCSLIVAEVWQEIQIQFLISWVTDELNLHLVSPPTLNTYETSVEG